MNIERQFCMISFITSCLLSKCPQWSNWYPWSVCSKSCGDGTKTRRRVCLNSSESHTCSGAKNETVECNIRSCAGSHKLQTTKSGVLPFDGNCEDKYSFCSHWQKKGYCDHRFTKWMSINCPVACAKCTKVKEVECFDRYPVSCPRWSKQNRCEHRDVFLREYIKRNCKLSCELC